MTTYRVGSEGATVFDSEGRELLQLLPGTVVVPGTSDTSGSLAEQHKANAARQKMVRRYSDKMVHVAEDKSR